MGNSVSEYITKFILIILAGASIYWLYVIIREPINERERRQKRKNMVIERLEKAREAQKAYKDKYGKYTPSWDTLMNFIKHDSLALVKTKGDPNTVDSLQDIERDTTYIPVEKDLFPDYSADSIQYAPFTGKRFKMNAGTITLRGVDVRVFEIKDVKPINNRTLKVGSMEKGITSGNW